jgi:hypothetical protein
MKAYTRHLLPTFVISVIAIAIHACGSRFKNEAAEEGYELAKQKCASCHKFPEAELLDKKTWANAVLPKMSGFFGLQFMDFGTYFEDETANKVEQLSLADWKKILSYYTSEAPDSLKYERKQSDSIIMDLPGFLIANSSFTKKDPFVTYTGYFSSKNQLLFADGAKTMYVMSAEQSVIDSFEVETGVSSVYSTNDSLMVLSMGVLHPSDEKVGKLTIINSVTKQSLVIIDTMQRPVHMSVGDLNNDNLDDLVISEFGNISGQLVWYENESDFKYKRHVLRPLPGSTRTELHDFNNDGQLDIMVLMAQADEGMFIYFNNGNGGFTEKRILQFSPAHGSNYFELADFNADGHLDILATNGDNGDYFPPILKPYHGVRIYMNDGKNNFKESTFLFANGMCKAMARDFDGDGDLDIASISYFPDYDKRPEESFIYFENEGDLSFKPYSFLQVTSGRWLTMEAADIDADNDIDIVLGNCMFSLGYVPPALMQKWKAGSPAVLVLKNDGQQRLTARTRRQKVSQ